MTDSTAPLNMFRAMSNDGAFRIISINATALVRQIFKWQQPPASVEDDFAQLLMGTVLVRETMSPGQRVQATLKIHGGTSLMADAQPGGVTRGLISNKDAADSFELGPTTALAVTRVLFNNELHQGVVSTRAEDGVEGAISDYFQQSEQVASVVRFAVVRGDDGEIRHVGGFVLQLLPEVTTEVLAPMTRRLDFMPAFEDLFDMFDGDAARVIQWVMEDIEYEVLAKDSVIAQCPCSEQRVVAAMTTLGRDELEDIVNSGEIMEILCDYCQTVYRIGSQQLKPLLSVS